MEYFRRNDAKQLFERLKLSLSNYSNRGFNVKLHEQTYYDFNSNRSHDITIYKRKNPVAVFEIRQFAQVLPSRHNQFLASFDNESLLSRFKVIYADNRFYLNDTYVKNDDFIQVNYEELLDKIVNPEPIRFGNKEKQEIKNIFLEAQEELLKENIELKKIIRNKQFQNCLNYKENSFTCYFEDSKSGISEFENQFFISLLGKFKESQICRYTTVDTIFSMLNYMSFRMSGLVGMNDRTEVNYVDTYLKGFEKPLIDEHHTRVSALNRRYITSCTTLDKKDELTMWRLYADDSKGVCLTFDVNPKNTNDHVLIQEVKYADENGKHPELEFLRAVQTRISNVLGFTFQFRKLGIWKHFFKAYEYEIEKEVRLMVIDDDTIPKIKTDWVLTYTHSILNPIIDFQLNSSAFPIQLKEIMLGSKCPEQEINKVQMEEMLRRKRRYIKDNNSDKSNTYIDSDLNKINVELSAIKHYR